MTSHPRKRAAWTWLAAGALLSFGTVSAQTYNWQNVTIVAGGFVDGFVFHPSQKDLIYARTDMGGAYRWDAASRRWVPLLDWTSFDDWNLQGVESMAVDPTDANRLYLACGTYTNNWAGNASFLRSTDQGRTFQRSDVPFKMGGNEDGRFAGERLAVDPNQPGILYFGSRHNGLWKSADHGATWNKVSEFPVSGDAGIGITFLRFVKGSGAAGSPTPVIFAGVASSGTNLYRSTDAGATWAAVPGQPPGMTPFHGALASDGWMYLTYGDQPGPNGITTGMVRKFNVNTGEWGPDITPPKGQGGFGGISVDAQRPGTVMVSTIDRWWPGDEVYRSTDGGATWQALSAQAVRDVSLSPWVTFGRNTAGWGNWMGSLEIDPFDSDHVIYGTGQTIWASHDATAADSNQPTHWAVEALGVEQTAILALASPPAGANLLSAMGDIGSFRHDDFRVSPAGGAKQPVFGTTRGLDFAEKNPAVVVRSGDPGADNRSHHGAYSVDGGTTWTAFAAEPAGASGNGSIAVSADGGTFVWSLQNAGAFYSTDRGATWTACAGAPAAANSYSAVVSDRVNPNKFYLFLNAAAYVSTDAGRSFTPGSHVPVYRDVPRAVPAVEGDIWLAGNARGLFRSTDSGATFSPLAGVQEAYSIGFGKAPSGADYPALYLAGKVNGLKAIYRSDDRGRSWVRINDDRHQYSGGFVIGDPRVYGRVYLGTNGRGILYGDLVTTVRIVNPGDSQCQTCQVVVEATAADGSPVSGITVSFSADSGSLNVTEAVTDAQGRASVVVTPQTPGLVLLRANVAGLPPALTSTHVNGASFVRGPAAPDSFVAAYGTSLATGSQLASTIPYPTSLGGTVVKVRDSEGVERLAPVYYVSPGQVNYTVPTGTASGPATVSIVAGDGAISTASLTVAPTGPALFLSGGTNLAAANVLRIRNGAQTYEDVWARGTGGGLVAAPIDLGPDTDQVYLILYGTGIRGHGSGPDAVKLTIGGMDVPAVAAVQPQYPGLDQVNVALPRALAGKGDVAIQLTVDGQAANVAHVSVK